MSTTAFDHIYSRNTWGFGSGHGSLPKVTKPYRDFVQSFMRENGITSVVDFGCGDWQISRLMDWSGVEYLGLDVVQSVIDNNRAKYGSKNINFRSSPDQFTDVPSADLLLVKDVLQHLPSDAVHRFMAQVVKRFRFALITNCFEPASQRNGDIQAGDFRPLDLRAAPFAYPATAVFAFSGGTKLSLRTLTRFPAWHKVVLLYSQG